MSRFDKESIVSKHYYGENTSEDTLMIWLLHLIDEEKTKQIYRLGNSVTPFLAVPTTVVQIIFYICEEFQQPPDVRYLSVELFDSFNYGKFLTMKGTESLRTIEELISSVHEKKVKGKRFTNNQFLTLSTKIWPHDNAVFENQNWKEISSRISEQALLRVMSCIALASKFIVYNKVVTLRQIQDFLHGCDKKFSIKTILASEMRVFKILDYKLHLPTVLTSTDLLTELTNWPSSVEKKQLHEVKLKITDLTYLHHQEIFHKLFYYSSGRWEKTNEERKEFLTTECNNIFMAAAVVLTCTVFMQPKEIFSSSLSTQTSVALEKLTDIPSDDIIALASVIIMMILN